MRCRPPNVGSPHTVYIKSSKATERQIFAFQKKPPNDSFPLAYLISNGIFFLKADCSFTTLIDQQKHHSPQTKKWTQLPQPKPSNPPPKPTTKQPPPGSHLPTRDTTTRPHHLHPTGATFLPCQAPSGRSGAGLAGRVAEAHRSRGARDADGRGAGDVRRWRFGCSTGVVGVYRESFKGNVGEGGKEGNH